MTDAADDVFLRALAVLRASLRTLFHRPCRHPDDGAAGPWQRVCPDLPDDRHFPRWRQLCRADHHRPAAALLSPYHRHSRSASAAPRSIATAIASACSSSSRSSRACCARSSGRNSLPARTQKRPSAADASAAGATVVKTATIRDGFSHQGDSALPKHGLSSANFVRTGPYIKHVRILSLHAAHPIPALHHSLCRA